MSEITIPKTTITIESAELPGTKVVLTVEGKVEGFSLRTIGQRILDALTGG